MVPKIIDEVQNWLKGLSGKSNTPDKPRTAVYKDETVYVYSETKDYAVVSRYEDGTKLFSINPKELK